MIIWPAVWFWDVLGYRPKIRHRTDQRNRRKTLRALPSNIWDAQLGALGPTGTSKNHPQNPSPCNAWPGSFRDTFTAGSAWITGWGMCSMADQFCPCCFDSTNVCLNLGRNCIEMSYSHLVSGSFFFHHVCELCPHDDSCKTTATGTWQRSSTRGETHLLILVACQGLRPPHCRCMPLLSLATPLVQS